MAPADCRRPLRLQSRSTPGASPRSTGTPCGYRQMNIRVGGSSWSHHNVTSCFQWTTRRWIHALCRVLHEIGLRWIVRPAIELRTAGIRRRHARPERLCRSGVRKSGAHGSGSHSGRSPRREIGVRHPGRRAMLSRSRQLGCLASRGRNNLEVRAAASEGQRSASRSLLHDTTPFGYRSGSESA